MQGGTYIKQPDGTLTRIGGTEPHPDGDRARDADGAPFNGRAAPQPDPAPAETETAPVPARARRVTGEKE